MRKLLWITLLCYVAPSTFALNDEQMDRALKACFKGRNKWGENTPGKLPPYDLGRGYICESNKLTTYSSCINTPGENLKNCLVKAEETWVACNQNPCPYLNKHCQTSRCTRKTNSWSCWKPVSEGGKVKNAFGFGTIYEDGTTEFVSVAGDIVPKDLWNSHCARVSKRCNETLQAPKLTENYPVDFQFCSAKCSGHNCHHATSGGCDCLLDKGVTDVRAVVFEDKKRVLPFKVGNIAHSMLTIPHPEFSKRKAGVRCLLESQAPYTKIEEPCCYSSEEEFKNIPNTSCSDGKQGPFQEKLDFSQFNIYKDCTNFLFDRGTCNIDTLPRKRLKPLENH